MWQHQTPRDQGKRLNWKDFPLDPDVREDILIPQITGYMRRLLEKYEESEFIKYLVLPSPTALSGYFHCRAEDVLEALQELQRQGYEYEAAGEAGPITLWDPLIRRQPQKKNAQHPWQILYDAIFNPIRQPLTS